MLQKITTNKSGLNLIYTLKEMVIWGLKPKMSIFASFCGFLAKFVNLTIPLVYFPFYVFPCFFRKWARGVDVFEPKNLRTKTEQK